MAAMLYHMMLIRARSRYYKNEVVYLKVLKQVDQLASKTLNLYHTL